MHHFLVVEEQCMPPHSLQELFLQQDVEAKGKSGVNPKDFNFRLCPITECDLNVLTFTHHLLYGCIFRLHTITQVEEKVKCENSNEICGKSLLPCLKQDVFVCKCCVYFTLFYNQRSKISSKYTHFI